MRIVKLFILTCITISVFSCSNGGPLTPVESLKTIREAANNADADDFINKYKDKYKTDIYNI